MTKNDIPSKDMAQASPDNLSAENRDLKTAEQVLDRIIEETTNEWVRENLEASRDLLRSHRGMI